MGMQRYPITMVTKMVKREDGAMLHVAFMEQFTTKGKLRLFVPAKDWGDVRSPDQFAKLYENYELGYSTKLGKLTLSERLFGLITFSLEERGKFGCTKEKGREIWRVLQKMGLSAWGADHIDYNGEEVAV